VSCDDDGRPTRGIRQRCDCYSGDQLIGQQINIADPLKLHIQIPYDPRIETAATKKQNTHHLERSRLTHVQGLSDITRIANYY
jgi:hypothetical protein